VTRDTDAPTGNDWANIVGNWGEDDGIGKMAKVPGSATKWQLIMTPASYYNLAADQDIHWYLWFLDQQMGMPKDGGC